MKTLDLNLATLGSWTGVVDKPVVISGPCSAETEEQLLETCRQLKATGKVDILRAGIWKPRTRPNSFEGVGSEALRWLAKAKQETGLKTAVEVANVKHVYDALNHRVDILWIGARTTVNPFSVQEIADALKGVDIPVMIKNPINQDLDLWIGAIERMYGAGITKIAAIHRGFSKFGSDKYRNAPQWHIPIDLKLRIPNIPIICDPSHICGNRELLAEVSQKAIDLNFDGLMIESHIDPDNAWSDAKQQVTPQRFAEIIHGITLRSPEPESSAAVKTLTTLRQQIDQFDDELILLLSKRMEVAEQIGLLKRENNFAILQVSRWQAILDNLVSKGAKLGLSEGFLTKLLDAIHVESINKQNIIMNKVEEKTH